MRHDFTRRTIGRAISKYIATVDQLKIGKLPKDPVEFFVALKRKPMVKSHYSGCTIFEVANRTLSDLVVLGLAELLLTKGVGNLGPLGQLTALLGNKGGIDVTAQLPDKRRLVAECFNVAPSFFSVKLQQTKKKLRDLAVDDVKVVAFNKEAAPTWKPRATAMLYQAIDVDDLLARYRARN